MVIGIIWQKRDVCCNCNSNIYVDACAWEKERKERKETEKVDDPTSKHQDTS